MSVPTAVQRWSLPSDGLDRLIALLHADGRTVIGPRLRDGVIVLDEIHRADDLAASDGVVTPTPPAR